MRASEIKRVIDRLCIVNKVMLESLPDTCESMFFLEGNMSIAIEELSRISEEIKKDESIQSVWSGTHTTCEYHDIARDKIDRFFPHKLSDRRGVQEKK